MTLSEILIHLGEDREAHAPAGGADLHGRRDRLVRRRWQAGKNLRLHPQHLVGHVFRLEGSRDEEARLREVIPEDGG